MAKVGETDSGHPMHGLLESMQGRNGIAKAGLLKRMRMAGARKGILFTISVLLLSISLLAFATYLAEQTAKSRQTAISLLELDRTTDTYEDLQSDLGLMLSGSINVTVQNSTVLLSENLPIAPGAASDFDRFAQFEGNFSDLNVTLSLSNLKQGSLLVQPGAIAITHSPADFFITPGDSQGSSGSVRSYELNITSQPSWADGASWGAVSNSSENRTSVRILVRDTRLVPIFDSGQMSLDKNGTSRLNITQGGSLVGFVQFAPASAVQVHYSGNIGLKASIGLTNPAYVEANDTISVLSAANKTGRIRIA